MLLRIFLSTRGLNADTVATRTSGESFSSGLERLLAMPEKFEATADDFSKFRIVEDKYYHLFKKWQDASANNDLIDDKYKVSRIPENPKVEVKFHEPEMIQTQKEREESAIRLMDAGLMSRQQAIALIYDVGDAKAEEIVEQIDSSDIPPPPAQEG